MRKIQLYIQSVKKFKSKTLKTINNSNAQKKALKILIITIRYFGILIKIIDLIATHFHI